MRVGRRHPGGVLPRGTPGLPRAGRASQKTECGGQRETEGCSGGTGAEMEAEAGSSLATRLQHHEAGLAGESTDVGAHGRWHGSFVVNSRATNTKAKVGDTKGVQPIGNRDSAAILKGNFSPKKAREAQKKKSPQKATNRSLPRKSWISSKAQAGIPEFERGNQAEEHMRCAQWNSIQTMSGGEGAQLPPLPPAPQIGRASCRERVKHP